MKYNPDKHHRRSVRLKGYNYTSPGAYFITICTYRRHHLFGTIVAGVMELNTFGRVVDACWRRIPQHFQNASLDAFVVMPDHLHGIMCLSDAFQTASLSTPDSCVPPSADTVHLDLGLTEHLRKGEAFGQKFYQERQDPLPNASPLQDDARPLGTMSGSIAAIVQNFKSVSSRQINALRCTPGTPVWQRNYYESVIRDPGTFQSVQSYIEMNPLRWHEKRSSQHSKPKK